MMVLLFAKRYLFVAAAMLLIVGGIRAQDIVPDDVPIDPDATAKTKALYAALHAVMDDEKILFGHQHTTCYGINGDDVTDIWEFDDTRSDVKDTTGAFPAVYGWDFWHQGTIDQDHMAKLMKDAYDRGGVNTMSWHMENLTVGGGDAWTINGNSVAQMLPEGSAHDAFVAKLAEFADFMLALKDDQGNPIPVIFRPFHEHTGSWFWWGEAHTTPADFIELWRFMVDYFRAAEVHNLLYAYSPGQCDTQIKYLESWPGDDYVDIVGKDHYFKGLGASFYWSSAKLVSELQIAADIAAAKGKVAALTEFGYQYYGYNEEKKEYESLFGMTHCSAPDWYMNSFLNPLKGGGLDGSIAFCLTWRNQDTSHYWVPYASSSFPLQQAQAADFVDFYNDTTTVFNDTIPPMYVTMPVIKVSGNGQGILDDDLEPAIADGTDFGLIEQDSGLVERTFVIANDGEMDLDITSVALVGDSQFTIVQQPASMIAGGQSSTMVIRFEPTIVGASSAIVVIENTGNADGVFAFAVEAEVSPATGTTPTVTFTSPIDGAEVSNGTAVYVTVDAYDDSGINRVWLQVDGTWISRDTMAPYKWDIGTLSIGKHTLLARATPVLGDAVNSKITIEVVESVGGELVVSFESPGEQVSASEDINVRVATTDGIPIVRVWLQVDGQNPWVGYDNTAPYEWTLLPLSIGEHTLVARAFPTDGDFVDSSFTITVVDDGIPIDMFANFTNGTSFSTAEDVVIDVDAGGGDSDIKKVWLKLDDATTWLGDAESPYSWNLGHLSAGEHTIVVRAIALDNDAVNSFLTIIVE